MYSALPEATVHVNDATVSEPPSTVRLAAAASIARWIVDSEMVNSEPLLPPTVTPDWRAIVNDPTEIEPSPSTSTVAPAPESRKRPAVTVPVTPAADQSVTEPGL